MIPAKPLELTLPAKEDLLLDDLQLFEPDGFSVRGFKEFIARYSNWKAAEVGKLTAGEMQTVTAQVVEKLQAAAVPKVTSAGS